jgi:hypothetical protein
MSERERGVPSWHAALEHCGVDSSSGPCRDKDGAVASTLDSLPLPLVDLSPPLQSGICGYEVLSHL